MRSCYAGVLSNSSIFLKLFVTVDRLAHDRKLIGRILENTMLFSKEFFRVPLIQSFHHCQVHPNVFCCWLHRCTPFNPFWGHQLVPIRSLVTKGQQKQRLLYPQVTFPPGSKKCTHTHSPKSAQRWKMPARTNLLPGKDQLLNMC